MSGRRLPVAAAFAALLLVASVAAAIAWLTREPPRAALRAPAAAPPTAGDEAPPPPPSPAPAPPPAGGDGCPVELAAAEILRADALDVAWAMCRLFGNFDPGARAARAAGERAIVVVSAPFADGRIRRHVLVIGRQVAGPDGAVLLDRRMSARLDAWVYERDPEGWRLATSGALAGPETRPDFPEVRLLRVGAARHALLVAGSRPDEATLHAISEPGLPELLPRVPLGGSSPIDCAPPRCFAWTAELEVVRGRDPDYDDLVVRVKGTRPDDDESVRPVDETRRWVRRDGRYVPD
jgi:hypothetical protein